MGFGDTKGMLRGFGAPKGCQKQLEDFQRVWGHLGDIKGTQETSWGHRKDARSSWGRSSVGFGGIKGMLRGFGALKGSQNQMGEVLQGDWGHLGDIRGTQRTSRGH